MVPQNFYKNVKIFHKIRWLAIGSLEITAPPPTTTIATNNSIIQQIQGIFNINETPSGNNNVLNLISNVTFSAGNVLIKCVDSSTTATTTAAINPSSTVVITLGNAGIVVGMKITGTGISATPPIVTAKSGTTITMSTAQTLSASTV
jgi:hypothetical protein